MLYVSATNPRALYTAQQTMSLPYAADGSPFVPLRVPEYDQEELAELLALPFLDCVCRVINRFLPVWLPVRRSSQPLLPFFRSWCRAGTGLQILYPDRCVLLRSF